jgi:hypothetical protein
MSERFSSWQESSWFRVAIVWFTIWLIVVGALFALDAPYVARVGVTIGGCYQAPFFLAVGLFECRQARR